LKVAIKIEKVLNESLSVASKWAVSGDLETTISVKALVDPGTIARLINLQKMKGSPLYLEIGSLQATLDIFAVGVATDEAMASLNQMVLDETPAQIYSKPSDLEPITEPGFDEDIEPSDEDLGLDTGEPIDIDDLPFNDGNSDSTEPQDAEKVTTVNDILNGGTETLESVPPDKPKRKRKSDKAEE
jgi:hypothetical protein